MKSSGTSIESAGAVAPPAGPAARPAEATHAATRPERRIPPWARPWLLPLALAALAAAYLALVERAALTAGAVFLCLGAAALGLVAYHLVGTADALVRGADDVARRSSVGRRRRDLLREKAAILKALKELEFDHQMGKISDADFREIGERLRARARRVLRALDESGGGYRAAVEEEIRRRGEHGGSGEA